MSDSYTEALESMVRSQQELIDSLRERVSDLESNLAIARHETEEATKRIAPAIREIDRLCAEVERLDCEARFGKTYAEVAQDVRESWAESLKLDPDDDYKRASEAAEKQLLGDA